jgi:hypothetical protein
VICARKVSIAARYRIASFVTSPVGRSNGMVVLKRPSS